MKIAVNVKLQNVFRVICMEEEEFENPEMFITQGNLTIISQYLPGLS